jgi:hypothetical protein
MKAVNSKDDAAVKPRDAEISCEVVLKKHSWNMLIYKY